MNNRAIANLTLQLQKSLDSNYDVVDMQTVLFVIQQLENTTITKEQLETTRLAKYINELRRRTSSETLARRAKNLLKKWRDSFMPTYQQQPPPQQIAPNAVGTTAPVSNPAVLSTPPLVTASNHNQSQQHQRQQAIVANNSSLNSSNNMNKISTGSANNNNSNTSGKNNSNLPNGGCYQQQSQQQLLPGSQQRVDVLKSRGTRVISPMMSAIASVSGADRKQQHFQQQQQPTSFANVLSRSQTSAPSLATPGYNYYRSESPLPNTVAATATTQQPVHSRHHRQSPVNLLDYDSNHSRSQQTATSSSKARTTLLNGENNLAGASNTGVVAGDLHDSNSVTLDLGVGAGVSAGVSDEPVGVVQKLYSTPPTNAVVADICSSSSSHRKSKKHKKDKKRNKQSPDKPPPTSELAIQSKSHASSQGATSFLNQYVGEFRPMSGGEDEIHNTAVGGTVFPPHDSLSSSSMSRFPSNISTNTMTIQNNSPLVVSQNDISGQQAPNDSDLTFAGKFKNSSNAGFGSIISANVIHSTVKKTYSDSKDSSDVVVVESRSCSPFTTGQMGPEDSCSSSSRATMVTETLQQNADSNLESIVDSKCMQPQQRLQQSATGQQEHGANFNSVHGAANILGDGTSSTMVPEQQSDTSASTAPKKRGRKKGSRGFDAVIAQTHALLNVSMFERPRLLLGSKKVKTTKELLADIQNRKLGSSATSSPTLATSRQSVSPSTCSEASFQSDLTNTRASLLNTRSSPELVGALANCRQSDIDDMNSATDSNDAKPPTLLDGKMGDTKSVPFLSSVDEYLHNLMRQLPPIDYSKLNQVDTDVVCTCTVRVVEPVIESPKKEVVIIKSEDEEDDLLCAKNGASDFKRQLLKGDIRPDPSLLTRNVATVAPTPMLAAEPKSPVKKSPKKPVKSIFDLDYDEDNDPLHSFVEAAKLRLSQKAAEEEGIRQQPASDGHDAASGAGGNFIAVNSIGKSNHISSSSSPVISIVTPVSAVTNAASLPAPAIPQSMFFDGSMPADLTPPLFPQYEVVEDPNCAAKNRYEVQTNRITKYHIDTLHNCYVKNVNGNWSAPIPMTAEHKKRLRRYYLKMKEKATNSTVTADNNKGAVEDKTSENCSSWWVNDAKFLDTVRSCESSSGDESLYERVVPQYDHIIMDSIVKDLSQVKFTPNYVKKKLRRLKREAERIAAAAASVKSHANPSNSNQNIPGDGTIMRRRKRSRTISAKDTTDCNSDDGGEAITSGKKHKHQRRKKHRKVRETNLGTSSHVDTNLSRNEIQDAIHPDDEGIGNGDGQGDRDSKVFTTDNRKPSRFSDTDNACDVDISQVPGTTLHESPDSEERLATGLHKFQSLHNHQQIRTDSQPVLNDEAERRKLGLDLDLDMNLDLDPGPGLIRVSKTEGDDHHVREDTVDVTLIESSSNSSSSCTSNVNNNSSDKVKENNQSVAASMLNEDVEEGSNSHDYSYYSGDGDAEMMDADGGGDDDADEADDDEYDDEDEDYDEDDHINDEEHEVVTHDMTSSTSTTSQQHIVLTIKKKISKSASSHGRLDGNDLGKVSPLRLTAATINLKGNRDDEEEQLSIITSSSTPTTIKIRRKNHQQQKASHAAVEHESQQSHHTISGVDYDGILDNNNVKIGAELSIPGGNAGDGDTSGNTMSEKEGLETNEFPRDVDEVDEKPMNFDSSADNHPSVQVESRRAHGVELKPSNRQSPGHLPSPDLKQEVMLLDGDHGRDDDENDQKDDIVRSDVDSATNCSNDDNWQALPKENNGLLASFNELNDDNYSGLRVITKACDRSSTSSPVGTSSATAGRTADNIGMDASVVLQPASSDAGTYRQQRYQIQEFKEWHEVLQVPSYNDELLTILPYVVID